MSTHLELLLVFGPTLISYACIVAYLAIPDAWQHALREDDRVEVLCALTVVPGIGWIPCGGLLFVVGLRSYRYLRRLEPPRNKDTDKTFNQL